MMMLQFATGFICLSVVELPANVAFRPLFFILMHRNPRTVAAFYVFVYLFIWDDFRHTTLIKHLIFVMDLCIIEIITEHLLCVTAHCSNETVFTELYIVWEFKCNITLGRTNETYLSIANRHSSLAVISVTGLHQLNNRRETYVCIFISAMELVRVPSLQI